MLKGDRATDPPAGAGDNGHLAIEPAHLRLLCCICSIV
jgi:hypothetical protein